MKLFLTLCCLWLALFAGSGDEKPDPLTEMAHKAQGSEGSDKFLNWTTSAAGVVRAARGPRGEVVTLEHDVCGRVTKRTITQNGFRPKTWIFEWNAMDQMVSTTTPEGDKYTYAYDPFGRRTSKTRISARAEGGAIAPARGGGSGAAQEQVLSRTEFIWDGDVLAYEETNGRRIEWFYEPNSFRPLARREGSNLHYIVNDHLGTPKEAFSERGSLVWSVDHDTWGTVRKAWMSSVLDPVPDEKGTFLGESFDGTPVHTLRTSGNTALKASVKPNPLFIPIRFQGQYEDAETGLFYNFYRYYEPICGAYCSADPIGLAGGSRPNAYTSFPNKNIDPRGLNDLVSQAQAYADKMFANGRCGAGGKNSERTVAAIQNKDGDIGLGISGAHNRDNMHSRVKDYYGTDNRPKGNANTLGCCGEVGALNDLAERGLLLDSVTSVAVLCGGPNHGQTKVMCTNCERLEDFGVIDGAK